MPVRFTAIVLSGMVLFGATAHAQPTKPTLPPGALSPENLKKPRPAAPFDLTGTWQHELRGAQSWKFVPEKFELTPEAQKHYDAGKKALAEGKVYRDDIGQCWPRRPAVDHDARATRSSCCRSRPRST